MKRLAFALIFAFVFAPPAWADFQAGIDAYERGDYAAAYWEWLPLAEEGGVEAQFNLGIMYNLGQGVAQSKVTAATWYRKSAEQGYAKAQFNLAIMFMNGEGIPQNNVLAYALFDLAADDDPEAAEQRDSMARTIAAEEIDRAVRLANRAREDDTAIFLGEVLVAALPAEPGHAEAKKSLRNLEAKRQINPRQAASSQVLTEFKNAQAVYKRGDYVEAARWYRRAAEQGFARAQNNLGRMYMNGQGVPRDYSKALSWYRKAAQQGSANSQTLLGEMYRKGQGVPQNYAEAARWYRKAAEQGHGHAQSILGVMYERGDGVPQNYAEAARWYRKAAEQGHARAKQSLGVIYYKGLGVPQDLVLAHMWWYLAMTRAKPGGWYETKLEGPSANALAKVKGRMTPGQKAKANQLAHEWMEKFRKTK